MLCVYIWRCFYIIKYECIALPGCWSYAECATLGAHWLRITAEIERVRAMFCFLLEFGDKSLALSVIINVCHHCPFLFWTPLGGGMMHENTQLYRDGNMTQTAISQWFTVKNMRWDERETFLTHEADGDAVAGHVSNTVHGGLGGELPESRQIHLYYFSFSLNENII